MEYMQHQDFQYLYYVLPSVRAVAAFPANQQLHPEERPLKDQIELLLTITRVIVIRAHTIHVTMYGIFTYHFGRL